MRTNGIGIGASYGEAPGQAKAGKKESQESYEPAAEKKIYARRPPAARIGQVSVMDVFQRMSENGSGINRAMARLSGNGVSVWEEQGQDALARVWEEYEQQLPEEEREGPIKKTETESEIIVKPDGTRVLVITVKTGGVVTNVMSMKISEPTREDNASGQEGANETAQEGEASQEGESAQLEIASGLEGAAAEGE